MLKTLTSILFLSSTALLAADGESTKADLFTVQPKQSQMSDYELSGSLQGAYRGFLPKAAKILTA